ncbi:NAD-dependent epimerase/dehydratase family protein [Massilia putida]|uniref:NAD-dependent epimerase/dehydratase family protein n=1 Tax=Massilia putida TaxID=1141883 RepID=UPI0009F96976|nr:NAD(P)-dependent oxidoreductase [Massilia putida]
MTDMIDSLAKQLSGAYRGKRILVTGATGFIGRHLVEMLGALGGELAILSRGSDPLPHVGKIFRGELQDRDFVSATLSDWAPHLVFHLAGARERNLTREAFDKTIEANLMGTLNLLYAALDRGELGRIVVLGTGEEYGRNPAPFHESMREGPISAYSFSKQCATQLSQLMHSSFGLPVVVVRPSVAYGPGQHDDMFLPALIQTLLRGEAFDMTLGEQTRDYVYVSDLVEAILCAGACDGVDGEIINVGSGTATRIAGLVEQVEAQLGIEGLVRRGTVPYRTGEPMEYLLDVSKARALLQWTPRTSLEAGLRETIAWYRQRNS